MLLLLTSLHLEPKGGASAFVSLAVSLLQTLAFSSNISRPRMALIDLRHPSLADTMYAGGGVVEWLKTNKAYRYQYRARADILV